MVDSSKFTADIDLMNFVNFEILKRGSTPKFGPPENCYY
jgi:hypothetical protein